MVEKSKFVETLRPLEDSQVKKKISKNKNEQKLENAIKLVGSITKR
jgi:hypothetical protein